jgi:dihydrofolate reductase
MKLILLMAVTVDGMIARDDAHFPDWTGRADKRLFVAVTKKAGVIIVGSKTFDTIGKPLPGRQMVVLTRNKARRSRWENLVFTDRDPADLLSDLQRQGYREAVLAGGATINNLFARRNLIDEIRITVSPLIFGRGISLFNTDLDLPLRLKNVQRLDDDLVHLIYEVEKPHRDAQPAS